jgi:hypothetical protein
MALTARDSEERALAMAMVIMGANTAGIAGAQIFREDDKPLYRRGFTINIAILAFGLSLAVIRTVDDYLRKRRHAQRLAFGADESSPGTPATPIEPAEDQPAPLTLANDRLATLR